MRVRGSPGWTGIGLGRLTLLPASWVARECGGRWDHSWERSPVLDIPDRSLPPNNSDLVLCRPSNAASASPSNNSLTAKYVYENVAARHPQHLAQFRVVVPSK
ncbi:hypothetical protein C8R43DRAFT_241925 [Mycena crocata]|nr:hypothetical protein C8R43DRAFT_241925 [Mycena crocata]